MNRRSRSHHSSPPTSGTQLAARRPEGACVAGPSDFLAGGGRMAARILAHDWTENPLGPPDEWPQCLRTAVRIMLTSRQPMFVWWGEELINLHNDAYSAVLASKDASALGAPARELWREIWDQIRPRAEHVMTRDEGTYDECLRLVLERDGHPEESWWTFSYSPIPGPESDPGGILGVCTDETRRVRTERDEAALREIDFATAGAESAAAAAAAAAASLVREPSSVAFAHVFLADGEGGLELAGSAGAPEPESIESWPVLETLASRAPRVVPVPAALRAAWGDRPAPRQAICVPFAEPGSRPLRGVLVAGLDPLRRREQDACEFAERAAVRIAAAVAVARDGEHESRSAEELARLERPELVARVRGVLASVRDRAAWREEARVLGALERIGKAVAAEIEIERVAQVVTEAATELSGAAFGAFFYNRVDASGRSYQLYALSGAPREAFAGFAHPRRTDVFAPTFDGAAVVRSDDITKDPRYGRNAPYQGMPPGHLPVRSYLAVPVRLQDGSVVGGLFFGHPEAGAFDDRAERLVVGIASQAAIAVDKARLYEAAQQEIENRRRAEEALKASEQSLRDADRRKDEFLATLAHELRNPLAPLSNALVLLELGAGDPATVAEARDVMKRQFTHLARLVDDLLDVSRISRGKLELRRQRVDVADAVASAIESMRPAIRDARHELALELPHERLFADGDPVRLAQVFTNVLHNAVKYTPAGGHIAVSVRRAGGEAVVSVRDDGIGIAPEMLPRIFEMFAQLESAAKHTQGGLGIGLSLVQRLVAMHGGRVEARSDGEGRGSEFLVRLPLVAEGAASDAPPDPASGPPRPATVSVLVVDDNTDAAETLAALLRALGHDVRTASSGAQAIALAKERAPHLILLDLGMPLMDGFETCVRLRQGGCCEGTLIVALTGWGQEEVRRQSSEAGFDDHYVKPIEPAALRDLLARAAQRSL